MAIIAMGFIDNVINGIKIDSSIECDLTNHTRMSKRDVEYIVMHYTGNSKDTAKNNANYFAGANREASAHFFVDNASIYQSVKLRDTAWHCGTKKAYYHNNCRNNNSLSIEMCCTAGNYKISDVTQQNAAYLCAHLCQMIGISAEQVDTYVLRHYDVTHKKCPAQMVDENEWAGFKIMVKNILKTGSAFGVTTSNIKENDLVEIVGTTYYNGKTIPSWVRNLRWYVSSVSGDRVVINKSENGKYAINSPVNVQDITVVDKHQIVKGSTVRIKDGANTYEGKTLKSFVYSRAYKVKDIKNDRVVVTYLGVVVAAIKMSDLILVE